MARKQVKRKKYEPLDLKGSSQNVVSGSKPESNVRIRQSGSSGWLRYSYKGSQAQRIHQAKTLMKENSSTHSSKRVEYNYFEDLIKQVSNNVISFRDAITMLDLRKQRDKSYIKNVNEKDYSERVKRDFKIGDIDKSKVIDKSYFNENIKPYLQRRDELIKKGVYEELRYLLFAENYKKALRKVVDEQTANEIYERIKKLQRKDRQWFINRAPDISSYYHPSEDLEEIQNDEGENILDILEDIELSYELDDEDGE